MSYKLMKLNAFNENYSYIKYLEIEKYLTLRYNNVPIICTLDTINMNIEINLEHASHILTNLRIEGRYLWGDVKVLDNIYGDKLRNMLHHGHVFAASYYCTVHLENKIQFPYCIHNMRCFPTDNPSF